MAILIFIIIAFIPFCMWVFDKGIKDIDDDLRKENEYWTNHFKK